MISQLNDNPVGKVLAGVSAGLLVLLLLLAGLWMLPPSADQAGGEVGGQAISSDVPTLEPARPVEEYAVIVNRPVFHESRQPIIGGEVPEGEEDTLDQQGNVEAPDVELAGVVITPDVRVATLRLKGEAESLLALEGEPLHGSFGSWRVSRIEPRSALLESANGEQVELQLQIHDAMMDAPAKPPPQAPSDNASNETAGDEPPLTRAEEIRQRIAQRREELRRAAEEGGPPPTTPQVNYREAIQSMIGARRDDQENDQENNDSEQ